MRASAASSFAPGPEITISRHEPARPAGADGAFSSTRMPQPVSARSSTIRLPPRPMSDPAFGEGSRSTTVPAPLPLPATRAGTDGAGTRG
eukprot:6759562-Prymnesium_polylepis.1